MAPRFVSRVAVALERALRAAARACASPCSPCPARCRSGLRSDEPVDRRGDRDDGRRHDRGRAAARIAYVPGCAARDRRRARARSPGSTSLLFDGTVLADDDLIRAGVGEKTGWRMGHVPMSRRGRLDRGARRACRSGGASSSTSTTPTRSLIEGSDERRARRGGRLDGGPRRNGGRPHDRAPFPVGRARPGASACSAPPSSRRPCATSARAATTTCTRSTASCTAASSTGTRSAPGR